MTTTTFAPPTSADASTTVYTPSSAHTTSATDNDAIDSNLVTPTPAYRSDPYDDAASMNSNPELERVDTNSSIISNGSVSDKRSKEWREAFDLEDDEELVDSTLANKKFSLYIDFLLCDFFFISQPSLSVAWRLFPWRRRRDTNIYLTVSSCFYACDRLASLSFLLDLSSGTLPAHGAALAKEILVHGRIYISTRSVAFKSNILGQSRNPHLSCFFFLFFSPLCDTLWSLDLSAHIRSRPLSTGFKTKVNSAIHPNETWITPCFALTSSTTALIGSLDLSS